MRAAIVDACHLDDCCGLTSIQTDNFRSFLPPIRKKLAGSLKWKMFSQRFKIIRQQFSADWLSSSRYSQPLITKRFQVDNLFFCIFILFSDDLLGAFSAGCLHRQPPRSLNVYRRYVRCRRSKGISSHRSCKSFIQVLGWELDNFCYENRENDSEKNVSNIYVHLFKSF